MDKLASHMRREKYGNFVLTEAIRPSLDLQVIPQEGYRIATYRDDAHRLRVPVLAASVSRERLFEAFLSCLEPLSDIVDIVLETSHYSQGVRHRDIHREHIDRPVLISHLCDFEDLLLNDGCTGLAVIDRDYPLEVQFDEHKLLLIYSGDVQPFEERLTELGLRRKDHMELITEGVHIHNSDPRHLAAFQSLCYRLGVGEAAEHVSG